MASAGCAAIAWLGLYGAGWNDYEVEVRPAFEALSQGHLGEFLRLAPLYGGSLIERAPFALLPGLWHGGALSLYRMVALPCLIASAVLGVWLIARMRAAGRPLAARALVLAICVANPITLAALEAGHPEELLGGCLCVAAMLLASGSGRERGRALGAGLLLGLAVANKQWAVLAAAPILLALPPGRRLAAAAVALASAAAVEAPLLLGSSGHFASTAGAVASPGSAIFQPWQAWWFLGHHGAMVHGAFGTPKPGYRIGPGWVGTISHPAILALGALLALGLWTRTRRARLPAGQALLALAVTLLARCLLDTWDTVYYLLPALLALLAWEADGSRERLPVLALALSALGWTSFKWAPGHISPDGQSALFLAWSLPLIAWLALRLLAGLRDLAPPLRLAARPREPQEMTVSPLGRLVSTSRPSGRTTTRSSIRTPSSPGR
jgi:hypothetical protein